MRLPSLALLCVLVLTLLGCGRAPGDVLPEPREGRSGVQGSGRLDGDQVAILDGLPTVNFADCDVDDGPDRDVCIITEDISGTLLVIEFENPDVLVPGAVLDVSTRPCSAASCDQVADGAVVELRVDGADPRRATAGQVVIDEAEAFTRYRGEADLRFGGDDRLQLTFDIIPRPEELSRR